MDGIAQSLFEALEILAPDAADRDEASRLAEVLESRAEAAAYLLLRHETIAAQPVVVEALAKLGALGLGMRNSHARGAAHTAGQSDVDQARGDLRSALAGLIDRDLNSNWAGEKVAERLREVEIRSPSGSLNGFVDRIRR